MREMLAQIDNERIEPIAKMLAANGVAQSLSFTFERKYLRGISSCSNPIALELQTKRNDFPTAPYWINISQIGKPLENGAEKCFSSIQKILTACFLPKKAQLIFLVHGEGGVYEMFLGVRSLDKNNIDITFVDGLTDFIKGIWPGMKCQRVRGNLDSIRNKINKQYVCIDSLTGIPSMESQYKTIYPATIDTLLAGMQKKNFTYVVIADPIESNNVDEMLFQCREMNGQAESLKSMNVTQGLAKSVTDSIAHTVGSSHSESKSESHTERKLNTLGKVALLGAGGLGINAAASFFPPAASVVDGFMANAAGAVLSMYGLGFVMPLLTKDKTISESTSDTTSVSDTVTQGKSETNSQSISRNIVNKQIEAVSEHLFYHSKRLETGKAIGCWSVGVYIMAENKPSLQIASMQMKSIISGQESIFEPVRVHHVEDVIGDYLPQTLGSLDTPIIRMKSEAGVLFKHPLGHYFNELKTVLTTKELSYLINFPLRSVPGISVIDSSPEFSLNLPEAKKEDDTIEIGKLLYGGSPTNMEYHIPLESLSRHTLLSGINGSGKTNTVQALLNRINGKIPFLVIEPAKTEYVDWALEYNRTHTGKPIDIYIPGCKKYKNGFEPKKLKLNPFELVWLDKDQEPNVLAHIDRLKSTFAAAFPMYDILPVLMEDLIYTVYQNKSTNWLTEEPKFGKTLPPTLNSMSVSVNSVIDNRKYEERIGLNMKACLNTRIDSLKRGWKGEMLNTIHSTPWEELFEKPCIINLSYVGDDVDKSFFMALVLQFLYEYRTALAEIGLVDFNDNSCHHLTVIEEAHRVMAKCENQELPQYRSAMMFSNMLSEIRAYGEGMFLVDQVPTRLIPDAIKNTNLKITHRLVAEDDCKAIGESMGLNDEQRKVIAKLMTGQCIVSNSLSTDTYWVKVNKVK